MRLLPEEAMNATTINSAAAMDVSAEAGSITIGKRANFFLTSHIPDISFLPYAYTTPLIQRVWLDGEEYV